MSAHSIQFCTKRNAVTSSRVKSSVRDSLSCRPGCDQIVLSDCCLRSRLLVRIESEIGDEEEERGEGCGEDDVLREERIIRWRYFGIRSDIDGLAHRPAHWGRLTAPSCAHNKVVSAGMNARRDEKVII